MNRNKRFLIEIITVILFFVLTLIGVVRYIPPGKSSVGVSLFESYICCCALLGSAIVGYGVASIVIIIYCLINEPTYKK